MRRYLHYDIPTWDAMDWRWKDINTRGLAEMFRRENSDSSGHPAAPPTAAAGSAPGSISSSVQTSPPATVDSLTAAEQMGMTVRRIGGG